MVAKDEFIVIPSYNRYKEEDLANEDVYYAPLSTSVSVEKVDEILREAFNGK